MVDTYVQILNSKRLIDLIEKKQNNSLYMLFENGYYFTTNNTVRSLNLFNFIILIISSLIVLFCISNSIDNIKGAYAFSLITVVVIILSVFIVNKKYTQTNTKKEKSSVKK